MARRADWRTLLAVPHGYPTLVIDGAARGQLLEHGAEDGGSAVRTNDLSSSSLADGSVGAVVVDDLAGFEGTLGAKAAEWRRILVSGGAVLLGSRRSMLSRPGFGRTVRTMKRQGFRDPLIYAALPNELETAVLLPLDDPRMVRYFLGNLVRKNSLTMQFALRVGGALAGFGLYRHLVPYRYLLFETEV